MTRSDTTAHMHRTRARARVTGIYRTGVTMRHAGKLPRPAPLGNVAKNRPFGINWNRGLSPQDVFFFSRVKGARTRHPDERIIYIHVLMSVIVLLCQYLQADTIIR